MQAIAVVPAAGAGRRFQAGRNKAFIPLLDRPLLAWTLQALDSCALISGIVPVVAECDMADALALIEAYGIRKVKAVAPGGRERQDSVLNGLKTIADQDSIVLIHDGARPLITEKIIKDTIGALEDCDGAVSAVLVKDTIKSSEANEYVKETLKREGLWAVHTPQVFRYKDILNAYGVAHSEGFYSTDDSALMERLGKRIRLVPGSYENIKVTTPEDLLCAEAYLGRRQRQ